MNNIKYYINSGDHFGIQYTINGITHIIKEDNDFRDASIPIYLSRIYNIRALNYNGQYYQQHNLDENFILFF